MRLLVSARWPAGRLWGRTPGSAAALASGHVTDFSLESTLLSPGGPGMRAFRAARHPRLAQKRAASKTRLRPP
jgi:hypothetical protein